MDYDALARLNYKIIGNKKFTILMSPNFGSMEHNRVYKQIVHK